jgi:hypothetical protein
MPRVPRLAIAFVVAAAVTGFGWLAVLPPWEGFDETAHYAYIQELADTGRLPIFGKSRISRDVDDYRAVLPSSYSTAPPFERNAGITYARFFEAPVSPEARAALAAPREFAPGAEPNWATQHPPLYYVLLAPLYSATRDWRWPDQLLAMRALSYVFAIAGLAWGVLAAREYAGDSGNGTFVAAVAAWPFFVPMFFSDMARLGNDSLCLAIAGLMWWQLVRIAKRPDPGDAPFVRTGALLGLGLLTKAFFIPLTVGVAIHLALARRWRGLAIALAIALVVGGPWYVYKYLAFGSATGADEHLLLASRGGLLANLPGQFSIAQLVRGVSGAVASFVWAGTWSLARAPEVFLLPMLLLMALPLATYLLGLPRIRPGDVRWAPFFLVGLVVAGLVHHVLVRIALSGEGRGTPGWYLHLLAGPLGFAFAIGLARIGRYAAARWMLALLAAYAVAYFAVVSWLQVAMYAGCAAKTGDNRLYAFPGGADCLRDAGTLFDRLAVIAHPGLAWPLLFGGIAAGAVLLVRLFRMLPRSP